MSTATITVTEPGIWPDMPEAAYHADPVPAGSLSSTGARKILRTRPAKFRYQQLNPPPSRPEFELGKAFHTLVLGRGAEPVAVAADNWRTKAAREERDALTAAGKVPLLEADYQTAQNMAAAVRNHDAAVNLLHPGAGDPEQSLFWVDQATGTWLRGRLDFLRNRVTGRVIVVDLKSCESAEDEPLQRAIDRYGYHQQGALYLDGVKALGIAPDPAFVFVFVEKDPPHLVRAVQLNPVAERVGRDLNRQAIDLFAACQRTDTWPGFSNDIESIALPAWVERQHTKEIW
ncbi:PD-(D/E)XK nuclease-like domain-containing protein [Verrucosispora sp. WMMD1129]|uniref:PD-(D/E)XK nuclease-like domain-containing protein n=1 Tax=Verrucosispora sp. WMMD1129 TaxID=3016093 RepID=UPI00249A1A28|nr:PD-(D/E)XK nuclease-like domain-containing protein [Verrucosispora sp. WMMD1129]WFE45328.1 PD-(D/E)XK nuclease-like domain-containing protein [Verrucosispora sp. WMMD1129]